MIIPREKYLSALIKKKWNGRIKIVTGIRRCGKSTLLLNLFRRHLLDTGVKPEQIIVLELDSDIGEAYRDPAVLSQFIRGRIRDSSEQYYVLLDEIQFAIAKAELRDKDQPVKLYSVLNGLLHLGNIDVYVTGSNSKMLSRDIASEFRGRGDVIQVYPFSFREYYAAAGKEKRDAYDEYKMFGGMPYLLSLESDEEKYDYLAQLFEEIFFKDIEERYNIALPGILRDLTVALCSSAGSLTNASKLARSIQSAKNVKVNSETISTYLGYLTDSFLFSQALRYDVKGKKYFEYPSKFYCTDIGLRNARLGLRQQEEPHIMENVIYNELRVRGYQVDVGVIALSERNAQGQSSSRSCEIDFIARKGAKKYYLQSAFSVADPDKENTELRPLRHTPDSFRKILISPSYGKSWFDETGILRIGLIDFLLDENSLDR